MIRLPVEPALRSRRSPFRRCHQRGPAHRTFEHLERREVLDAALQVIHNSPYEAAALVDVYVNDALLLDDFAFRSATPFVTVPSGVDLKVDITAADAADNSLPVFTATVNLAADTNYIAAAVGDPLTAVGPAAFGLAISALGRQAADNPANAEFLVLHGAPDAPAVDVVARGVGTLVDDIEFREYAGDYLSVPPGSYTVDITLANGVTRVRSFEADLSGAAGAALVVAASGFVAPQGGQPDFGLLAVFPDGTTALLPVLDPAVTGTNGFDNFTARLKPGSPGIVEVARGGEVTEFLTLTNPAVSIEGGRGADRLTVEYSSAGDLPVIGFDGGAGYDSLIVHGTSDDDLILLTETANLAGLAAGTIAVRRLESITVWAGAGDDTVDAGGLRNVGATIYGGSGDDILRGGKAHDVIFGGPGDDHLYGGPGFDLLIGGLGRDKTSTGSPFDFLFGLFGRDKDNRRGFWWF